MVLGAFFFLHVVIMIDFSPLSGSSHATSVPGSSLILTI